jgi:choline transport protein
MNWSCLIVGATIIFPGLYWTFRARHKYLKEGNSILEDNIVVVDGVAVSAMEAIKD